MDTADRSLHAVLSRQNSLAWKLSKVAGLCPPCSYQQSIAVMSVTPRLRAILLCADCQGIDISGALMGAEREGNRG